MAASATEQLCAVLAQAASPDPAVRRPADDLIALWERSPGFHASLQDIYLHPELDLKLRSLAIILLKNGISKYWRKSAENCIQKQEKDTIRSRLMSYFSEPQKQLAVQQALVTAAIARIDFPSEWPDLLQTLVPLVQASFATQHRQLDHSAKCTQHNLLYTLHLVVKALCSRALPASRRILAQVAPDIFRFISSIFYDRINTFMAVVQQQQSAEPMQNVLAGLDDTLSIARIALKTLRRLIVYAFPEFDTLPETNTFLHTLLGYMPSLLHIRRQLPKTSNGVYATLASLTILAGKVYLDLSELRPTGFALCLDGIPTLKFYWSLLESAPDTVNDETTETILIQGLRLLRRFIKNPTFSVSMQKVADERLTRTIKILDEQLFTSDDVVRLARLLISNYIRLSQEDLSTWTEDPESFVQEEEADHWEYHLRLAAEKTFMDLVSKNRHLLSPVIVQTLRDVSVQNDVLVKDAAYCAVGLAAHDLYDWLDFADWVRSSLVHEARRRDPGSQVLRRRVSWVIGKWVGVKAPLDLRPTIYEILLELVRGDEDLVVRLTAVSDLRACIDDFDFSPVQFQPFMGSCVSLFMGLLQDTDELESKLKVLNCLILVIERMEEQAAPYTSIIVQVLPDLWQRSEGQNVFRVTIVAIFTKLVRALRGDSAQLHEMVVPILVESVDISRPAHLYLLEEGLGLWRKTLQNAPTCTPALLSLLPHAIGMLGFGSSNLKEILRILESYVLLDAHAVLENHAMPITTAIAEMLGNLQPEASNAILRATDTVIQSCQASDCFTAIGHVLVQGPFLTKILDVVVGNKELGMIVVGYLTMLARLPVCDAEFFIRAVEYVGSTLVPPVPDLFNRLMDQWIEKFDAMGEARQVKLTALAMSAMLGTGHPVLIAHLDAIFGVLASASSMLSSLENEELEMCKYTATEDEEEDNNSLEQARIDALTSRDPLVISGTLRQSMQSALRALEAKLGGVQNVQAAFAHVDPDLLFQIKHFTQ